MRFDKHFDEDEDWDDDDLDDEDWDDDDFEDDDEDWWSKSSQENNRLKLVIFRIPALNSHPVF